MKIPVVVAGLVATLALVAAGCGGSDESSETSATVEWADDFCTALNTWTDSLEQLGDRFSDLSSLNQDTLEEAASDARAATSELADDLRALGRPDTESGDDAQQAVDDLVSTLEDDVTDIETTVEGVSGLTELPGAISSLTSTITSMATALSSAVSTIESADVDGELESAFEQSAACDELTGSSS